MTSFRRRVGIFFGAFLFYLFTSCGDLFSGRRKKGLPTSLWGSAGFIISGKDEEEDEGISIPLFLLMLLPSYFFFPSRDEKRADGKKS